MLVFKAFSSSRVSFTTVSNFLISFEGAFFWWFRPMAEA
jgi:hypothetical protein